MASPIFDSTQYMAAEYRNICPRFSYFDEKIPMTRRHPACRQSIEEDIHEKDFTDKQRNDSGISMLSSESVEVTKESRGKRDSSASIYSQPDNNLILNQETEKLYRIIEQKEEQTVERILDGHLDKILRGPSASIAHPIFEQKRQQVFRAIKRNEEQTRARALDQHPYTIKRKERIQNLSLDRHLDRIPGIISSPRIVSAARFTPTPQIPSKTGSTFTSRLPSTPRIPSAPTKSTSDGANLLDNGKEKQLFRQELGEALGNLDPYWYQLNEEEKEEMFKEIEKENQTVQWEIIRMNTNHSAETSVAGRRTTPNAQSNICYRSNAKPNKSPTKLGCFRRTKKYIACHDCIHVTIKRVTFMEELKLRARKLLGFKEKEEQVAGGWVFDDDEAWI